MLRRRCALRILGTPPLTASLRAGCVGQHGQAGPARTDATRDRVVGGGGESRWEVLELGLVQRQLDGDAAGA
jgi:hypothetical protein